MNQNYDENIKRLKHELETCDAILVGAGAGLSTGLVGEAYLLQQVYRCEEKSEDLMC